MLHGGEIKNIANIYAPNNRNEKSFLWAKKAYELPMDCRWIFANYYNMVELKPNKSITCGRMFS